MKFLPCYLVAAFAAATVTLPTSLDTETNEARSELENRAKTCTVAATNKLIFSASIKTFLKARKAKNPSRCDWSSDKCSKSPDKIPGFVNFTPFCQRHDFGYRNTKTQNRFSDAMRKTIDDKFLKDMLEYCAGFSGWSSFIKRARCREVAATY